MDKRWLICAKEDVFVFVEEEKELAKIKAIIPGSERRQLKVRLNIFYPQCQVVMHHDLYAIRLFFLFFFFFFNFIIIDCDKTLYISPGRELHIFAYYID